MFLFLLRIFNLFYSLWELTQFLLHFFALPFDLILLPYLSIYRCFLYLLLTYMLLVVHNCFSCLFSGCLCSCYCILAVWHLNCFTVCLNGFSLFHISLVDSSFPLLSRWFFTLFAFAVIYSLVFLLTFYNSFFYLSDSSHTFQKPVWVLYFPACSSPTFV